MASLPFRDQGVVHSIKMAHAPTGREAARWDGVQSVTTPAATQTLCVGEAGTNQIRIQNNIINITPDSDMRIVKLPSPAAMKGLNLTIVNGSADHHLDLQTSSDAKLAVIAPQQSTSVNSNGLGYIGNASGSEVGVRRTNKVSLTAANVNGLFTTAQEVVPAPGAGKWIEFVSAYLHYDYDTAAHGNVVAADELVFLYTDKNGAAVSPDIEVEDFLDQGNDEYRYIKALDTEVIPVDNAVLVLWMKNSDVNGGGNSKLHVAVEYIVRTTSLA